MVYSQSVTLMAVYFSGCLFWVCHGQVGGTRFQVGMTGADQRRYLRSSEHLQETCAIEVNYNVMDKIEL